MQKTFYKKHTAFRFRRYSRAGYAVFRSLHRVVNIGHVASYIANQQVVKTSAMALVCMLAAPMATAQSDEPLEALLLPVLDITLANDTTAGSPDAVVVISQSQLQGLPICSVGELLEQLSSVDVRTRGVNDVQADVSMRGSTFDQVVVLLNGVNISDPQTGHHNLDIPIDLSLVQRVEVIPASALLHYGISSFCGAINIVTTGADAAPLRLHLGGGSHSQARVAAAASQKVGKWNMLESVSYNSSGGYMENTDYRYGSAWLQAHTQQAGGVWDIQVGAQHKGFGSQAFYSTKYPSQYERTQTLTASVMHRRTVGKWQVEAATYARLHKDRFELFRQGYAEVPAWYASHNYHFSNTEGARLRALRLWQLGATSLGVDWRREGIVSNVLGDSLAQPRRVHFEAGEPYYTLGTARNKTSVFAQHTFLAVKDFSFSVSALASLIDATPYYAATASATYLCGNHTRLGASVVRSYRVPTFNDLYYHSATQISNPNLLPEQSVAADLWGRYQGAHLSASASVYARRGSNMIDWIRHPDSTLWHSMNHAQIDAYGVECDATYAVGEVLKQVTVAYSYCTLKQQPSGYVSNYVMDYMHQKVRLSLLLEPLARLRVKLLAYYYQRQGSYSDASGVLQSYSPVTLVNAVAEYALRRRVVVTLEGYNLLNRSYCDYGGVPQPKATALAGLRLTL